MGLRGFLHAPTGVVAALSLSLAGCGGGSDSSGGSVTPAPSPTPGASRLYPTVAQESLSAADVQTVIAQAVGEAQALNYPAVIAVVDRVGNVLAVFRMNGAPTRMITSSVTGTGAKNPTPIELQDVDLEASMGAIAKAVTAAYLSSSGNAFSTRTASMIVQEHFPPAPNTPGLEAGPLFGVQLSQLPCSDLNTRYVAGNAGSGAFIGPKRSPLGLAADPGGLPLYKNGVVVGGIGVMADGDYGFDRDVTNVDGDPEEYSALAGIQGFEPPADIRADKIPVDGSTLRFSDARVEGLHPLKRDYAAIVNVVGTLVPVNGYFDGKAIVPGTPYGTEASGFRYATGAEFSNPDAFVLTDGAGNDRYPIKGGGDGADVGQPLTAAEVRAVLEEAFKVMSRARAQIRRPLDSRAQVSISVVDTYGTALGVVRGPDAPLFGTDVSLQKARTAAFFSNKVAASQLQGDLDAGVPAFVQAVRTFLGDPTALTGAKAFADRSGGNLSRPFFPDGEVGRPNGPFSEPIDQFNPFATGLQAALIKADIVQHKVFVEGALNARDVKQQCTNVPDAPGGRKRLANGIQIFPGSVPIYRGTQLVGAIGISGDGIDQDDMIAFLGAHNGGQKVGSIGNAPKDMRADTIVVNVGEGVRLRYVNCPFAPFLDTSEQNVCEGL
ncbi:heme-binding protein [Novosphingobium sp. KCTC 2891]|uniref:heme-binding protein n=1 Tax=Novosphingobium sp. KCTC 2891 TaxID=2989730 RepID=UPI00222244F5|nr:heme-binding protein [Novosphingobium sp. KCTC 2891]MCW1381442.1 heme-binding protein [Novosphingobium sp. KCTC 2891]